MGKFLRFLAVALVLLIWYGWCVGVTVPDVFFYVFVFPGCSLYDVFLHVFYGVIPIIGFLFAFSVLLFVVWFISILVSKLAGYDRSVEYLEGLFRGPDAFPFFVYSLVLFLFCMTAFYKF